MSPDQGIDQLLIDARAVQADLAVAMAKLNAMTAKMRRVNQVAPVIDTAIDLDDGDTLALVPPRELNRRQGFITPLPPDGGPVRAPFVPPKMPTVILERDASDDFLRPRPTQVKRPKPVKPRDDLSSFRVFVWLLIFAVIVAILAPDRLFEFIDSLTK